MPVSTVRESLTAEGFIPSYPLPPRPHKNLDLRDAIKLARSWGCKIAVAGNNDFLVSHQLLQLNGGTSARITVPVSSHRNDTSQALVSFLRRVSDAVEGHPAYLKSIPTLLPTLGKAAPIIKEPAMTAATLTARSVTPPMPSLEPGPEHGPRLVGLPDPALSLDSIKARTSSAAPQIDHLALKSRLSEACKILGSIAAAVHYRDHVANMSDYIAFSACKNQMCENARRALANVDGAYGSVKSLVETAETIRADNDKLLDELTRPKPQPKDTPPAAAPKVSLPASDRPYTAHVVDPILADGDSAERAREKVGEMHQIFMARLQKIWAFEWAVYTRIGDALIMLMSKLGPAQMQRCYVNADFSGWKLTICGFKREGGSRCLVGAKSPNPSKPGGWDSFEKACEVLRKKYPAGHE